MRQVGWNPEPQRLFKSLFAHWSVSCSVVLVGCLVGRVLGAQPAEIQLQSPRSPLKWKEQTKNMEKNGKGRERLRTRFPTLGPTLQSNMAEKGLLRKNYEGTWVWVQIHPENKDFYLYSKIHHSSLLKGLSSTKTKT